MLRAGKNARKSVPVLLAIGAAAVISKYRLHEHLRLTYKRIERKLRNLPFNQRKLAGAAQADWEGFVGKCDAFCALVEKMAQDMSMSGCVVRTILSAPLRVRISRPRD